MGNIRQTMDRVGESRPEVRRFLTAAAERWADVRDRQDAACDAVWAVPDRGAALADHTVNVLIPEMQDRWAETVDTLWTVPDRVTGFVMNRLIPKLQDLMDDSSNESLQAARELVWEAEEPVIAVGQLAAAKCGLMARHLFGHRGDGTFGRLECDREFEEFRSEKYSEILSGRFGGAVRRAGSITARIGRFMDDMEVRQRATIHRIVLKAEDVFDYIRANERRVGTISACTLACFLAVCGTVNAGTVYSYSYHGTELGVVKDKEEVTNATEQLAQEGTDEESADSEVQIIADPTSDITYEKEFDLSAAVDSTEDVVNKLANCDELQGEGYAITIDGAQFALLDSEDTANRILNSMKLIYVTRATEDGTDAASGTDAAPVTTVSAGTTGTKAAGTAADVAGTSATLSGSYADNTSISASSEEAVSKAEASAITRNVILAQMSKSIGMVSDTDKTVDSETGAIDGTAIDVDTASAEGIIDQALLDKLAAMDYDPEQMAELLGVTLNDVTFKQDVEVAPATANVSDFMDYDNAIGLFISDGTIVAPVDICTRELVVYDMPIAHETQTIEDSSMYEDETEVVTPGQTGYKTVTAYLTRENGTETGRVILHEAVKTEPVTEVVKVGTKKRPSTAPTGTFIKPCSGSFSSGYGKRWGRTHQGIDLAASYGTPIYAADGGTVTYAQYNTSGYGNLIKISHGSGTETYYGHCSKLLVSAGEKVAQGQLIGLVGSTGRSTGNHLHFEIRFNGTPVNPLPYIS